MGCMDQHEEQDNNEVNENNHQWNHGIQEEQEDCQTTTKVEII